MFHRNYGGSKVDEALLSGFLAAIFSFASEIGHGGIQSMATKDGVFVYDVAEDYIFAVAVDLDDDVEAARSFLSQAVSLFFKIYREKGRLDEYFARSLELLVNEYNYCLMVKEVFCAPFLVLDKGERSEEASLAAAFLMLEKMRSQSVSLIKKKVNVDSVVKVLWPFWVVPTNAGECIIVDGLFKDPVVIKCFSPPELKEDEETSLAQDPVKSIDRIAAILREKVAYETFVIPGLIGYENAQELARFLANAQVSKIKDAVILRTVFSETEIMEVKEKFLNVLGAIKENAEKLKKLSEKVVGIAELHIKKLEDERAKVRDEYLERIDELRRKIGEERVKVEEDKKQKITEIEEQAWNAAWKEVEEIREDIVSLSNAMMNLVNYASTMLDKGDGGKREDKLLALEEVAGLLEKLRDDVKDVSEKLKRVEKVVRSAINDAHKKRQIVEQHAEKVIASMEKKIGDLKEEMEKQLSLIDKLKEKYRNRLKDIYNYLEEHMKSHEMDITALTGSMVRGPDVREPFIFFLTAYLAELRSDEKTQLILIPPVGFLEKTSNGKIKVDDVANKTFTSFLKKRFEQHVDELKLLEEARSFMDKVNLLKQKDLEPKIYDGLSLLLEKGYINKKDFSTVKMSVIELFR
ncbi:MAG: hypothetical protein QXK94_07130 [Candidatus Jordarchaeales archaeon]